MLRNKNFKIQFKMKVVLISNYIFGKFIITVYLNPNATVLISQHIETATRYLSNLSFLLS